jgi:hypothetical protein
VNDCKNVDPFASEAVDDPIASIEYFPHIFSRGFRHNSPDHRVSRQPLGTLNNARDEFGGVRFRIGGDVIAQGAEQWRVPSNGVSFYQEHRLDFFVFDHAALVGRSYA